METAIWIEDEFLKVDKLYEEGEYTECKRLLIYMLDEEPSFGKAHELLGWLYYYKLHDYEKALRHLKLAVKFAPAYAPAYINYIYVLGQLNRHEELIAQAKEALNIEGINKFAVHLEIGRSYELNGNYKKATKAYKEASRFAMSKYEVELIKENSERVKDKIASFGK